MPVTHPSSRHVESDHISHKQHTKISQQSQLGEHDKEGAVGTDEIHDKVQGTWEQLQTQGGKVLESVKSSAANLQIKAKEIAGKVVEQAREGMPEVDEDEVNDKVQDVTRRGKHKIESARRVAEAKISSAMENVDVAKEKLAKAVRKQNITMQDVLTYAVPLLILVLALTAGIAAYRSYTHPALPPLNTLDGLKARAGIWGNQAYDYVTDKGEHAIDYATERASLLAEQLEHKMGIYSDKAKEAAWSAKDKAAEQANLAYKEAQRQAIAAKKLADQKSREALENLRSYGHRQTKPEGFLEKMAHKVGEFKDNIAEKAGLLTEDGKHKANLAAENARHAAETAKIKGQHGMGGKIRETVHDVKENIKAKIHPHLN